MNALATRPLYETLHFDPWRAMHGSMDKIFQGVTWGQWVAYQESRDRSLATDFEHSPFHHTRHLFIAQHSVCHCRPYEATLRPFGNVSFVLETVRLDKRLLASAQWTTWDGGECDVAWITRRGLQQCDFLGALEYKKLVVAHTNQLRLFPLPHKMSPHCKAVTTVFEPCNLPFFSWDEEISTPPGQVQDYTLVFWSFELYRDLPQLSQLLLQKHPRLYYVFAELALFQQHLKGDATITIVGLERLNEEGFLDELNITPSDLLAAHNATLRQVYRNLKLGQQTDKGYVAKAETTDEDKDIPVFSENAGPGGFKLVTLEAYLASKESAGVLTRKDRDQYFPAPVVEKLDGSE